MAHIVLLGDSIFDNGPYVPNDPDVVTQLRAKLPQGYTATLNAIDGDRISDVHAQLVKLPSDATHLVMSVGGNDALGFINILNEAAASSTQVFNRLADISEHFEKQYHHLLQRILRLGLPTAICTIYYPNFPDRLYQRVTTAALTIFNDVIIREAFQAGIPLIDLRLMFNDAQDYANPIEPSARGGEKITNTILKILLEHDFSKVQTQVFY